MAIVVIKIGENEKSDYSKFNKLSKHLDIIEVLPRKRDKEGKLIERTAGVMADKEYLCINVDMDDLTDKEFNKVRMLLRESHLEDSGLINESGEKIINTVSKRLWNLDFNILGSLIGIDSTKISELNALADKRRNKLPYDVSSYHIKTKVPFLTFSKLVKNKVTSNTLNDELELTESTTLKDKMDKVIELLSKSLK